MASEPATDYLASPPRLVIDFTPEDYARLVRAATERGYILDGNERALTSYVHDCALGKCEPAAEPDDGDHVRAAVLVFGLAMEAWARAGKTQIGRARFADALRDVLADAANQNRLG